MASQTVYMCLFCRSFSLKTCLLAATVNVPLRFKEVNDFPLVSIFRVSL